MTRLKLIDRKDWILIGLVLVVCALAFLPQVGSLGYYHDDWFPTISRVSDVKLVDMHWGDRPWMGRWYAAIDNILGEAPLAWHLFAFLLRYAGALGIYLLARVLWPDQKVAAAFMAVIYAVYPGFLQQTSANNYQNHIAAYTAAIFSLVFSVLAVKSVRIWQKGVLTLIAVGMAFFYPRIYEAMIGMEGFRFILIWTMVRRRTDGKFSKTLRDSVLYFLPFLIVAGQFIYWRFFVFIGNRVSTDSGAILDQLRSNFLIAAGRIILTVLTDFIEMALGGWIIPSYQLGMVAQLRSVALAIGLGGVAVVVMLLVMRWLKPDQNIEEAPGSKSSQWTIEAIWLGILGILVTLLPVALTGRDVQYRIYNDRYTYQSIAPAALLLAGLIFASVKNNWRIYAISVLVFLAVFTHNLNASAYAKNWDFQKQVWWQMSWRVPQLAPGTALMVHMPPNYRYPEDGEIWAPASRIYYPGPGSLKITAEVLNNETVDIILNRELIFRNFRGVEFNKDFNQALITSMPTNESCLHVLDGAAPELSISEDPLVVKVAGISRIDRILTDAAAHIPPQVIFGREPQHDWCYTYQKASLARQQENWEEVVRLADEALAVGLVAKDAIEYAPLIEGYLHRNRISDAQALAAMVREIEPVTASLLCEKFSVSTHAADVEIAALAKSIYCEE